MEDPELERYSTLFKALADPARLRILGLLAERPLAGHELADRLALSPPTISHHVRKLAAAGLVDVTPDSQSRIYSLRTETFRDLSRRERAAPVSSASAAEDAVIRAFFDGSRLRQIPAARKKRVIVLRRLLDSFQPGIPYSEREVNDILRAAHDDVATLRRELVDYGFMVRDRGNYQVVTELPPRGPTVAQEVGNESDWFREIVAAALVRAATAEVPNVETPPSHDQRTRASAPRP
jgi:DNA-binding HxlR family transcriptional regulator